MIKAMKQALEALYLSDMIFYPQTKIAIAGLEKAIAEAEKQEPIIESYLEKDNQDADRFCDANCTWSEHHKDCAYSPQRQWVGLTDEEINKAYADSYRGVPLHESIEAKLKEKNT